MLILTVSSIRSVTSEIGGILPSNEEIGSDLRETGIGPIPAYT